MASVEDQLARLEKRLLAVPEAVKKALQKSLDKAAADVAAAAKRLAPDEDGTLAGTIRVEQGPHELSRAIVAGGDATTKDVEDGKSPSYDYAKAQELGTRHQRPRRFLRPAERILRRRNRARIVRDARKAIRGLPGPQT